MELNTEYDDGSIVSIEPWDMNSNTQWPPAHLQTVHNGKIKLKNESMEPIQLGKEVKFCKILTTDEASTEQSSYYMYKKNKNIPKLNNMRTEHHQTVSLDKGTCNEARETISNAHNEYQSYHKGIMVSLANIYVN